MAPPPMKTRRLALILLILGGVLFMAEVRLYDTGRISKKSHGTPSLWSPPVPASDGTPMKFVDPPMPEVPPGSAPREPDRRRR